MALGICAVYWPLDPWGIWQHDIRQALRYIPDCWNMTAPHCKNPGNRGMFAPCVRILLHMLGCACENIPTILGSTLVSLISAVSMALLPISVSCRDRVLCHPAETRDTWWQFGGVQGCEPLASHLKERHRS